MKWYLLSQVINLREVIIMISSSKVISYWEEQNKGRKETIIEHWIQEVDPSKIIGISFPYKYPEILEDRKMKKLKEKIKSANDWDMRDQYAVKLCLLKFPDGTMVVTQNGNHRAVLAKELKVPIIKAKVHEIVYTDN